MTRDTGHKYCKNNPEAPDLATPSYCAAGNIPQGGDRSNPWSMDDLRPSESGMPWPKLYQFKPVGDVYRQWINDKFFPTQGLAIYDSWLPQVIINNTYYDFHSKEGHAYRHAIGVHLGNAEVDYCIMPVLFSIG